MDSSSQIAFVASVVSFNKQGSETTSQLIGTTCGFKSKSVKTSFQHARIAANGKGTKFFGTSASSKSFEPVVRADVDLTVEAAGKPKRVLVVNTESGGHAFVGDYLARDLVNAGHEVTFFKKGGKPVTRQLPGQNSSSFDRVISSVRLITGDPSSPADVKDKLGGERFDVVIDNNGKDVPETQALVEATQSARPHFIYVSSAGMYKTSDEMPHREGDPVDTKSSKYLAEQYLATTGLPVTHIRPVYVYGPLNYRDIEAWFFDRILSGRPVPIPGTGAAITNLGHVEDMSYAIQLMLEKPEISAGRIYNISGRQFTTLDGLAKLCGEVANREVEIVHYDTKKFSFGKGKAFPLREKHFFLDTFNAVRQLGWKEAFTLRDGLAESLQYYKLANRPANPNFAIDDEILGAVLTKK